MKSKRKQMSYTFIVQARLGSSRLPGKILKPFSGEESILTLLIDKLKQVECAKIIIATSENSDNDPIEKVCEQAGVECFRGDENDVLNRFIKAAKHSGAERIIRICSDNPFLELDSIKELIATADANPQCDYISFKIGEKPSIQTHYGFWCEYVTLDALQRVATLTDESLYHEHVTNFIYSHADHFNIKWIATPTELLSHSQLRLTIDTEKDFTTAQQIYADLTQNNPYPTISEVVNFLDNNDFYYKTMAEQIAINSK